jgi:signal transduction histidine kinase
VTSEAILLARVAAHAKALRSGDVDLDRMDLAESLSALVDHPSPEVRQAVAGACDTFPEPYFSSALERLSGDVDRFVQNAAKRAGERRARIRKERRKDETREQVLEDLLKAIEGANSAKERRQLAERAVRRGVEHVIGRLEHEVQKSDRAIESAIAALDAEIAKPDPSPAVLRRQIAELREHFGFVRTMITRGHEYAARVRPSFAEESLAEVVDLARRQLFARLGERAGAVDFVNDVDPGLRMHADRRALLQALQNFFQNAVEAYGAGRARLPLHVSSRVLLAGAQVELRVVDQGQGITREGLEKLYVPFGSSKRGGTGVGMPIARKMIEEVHAGELVVESEVDVGTTVIIRLPTRQPGVRP